VPHENNVVKDVIKNSEIIMETSVDPKRVSPLRGDMTPQEIVSQTKIVRKGLNALRDDHYTVLANIRDDYENQKNNSDFSSNGGAISPIAKEPNTSQLSDRIGHVTKSLEQLEVGIAESTVLVSLHDHFERLEADRSTLRLEMGRVQDENEWLREELSDTQRQLQEALAELAEIKEEKKAWQFQEELRNMKLEAVAVASVRPVTPSKIPVGSWRVEEEKDINRALHSSSSSTSSTSENNRSRATSPAPSRIPVGGWRSQAKLSVYKRVMEKQEAASEAKKKNNSAVVRKSNYFKLNAPARGPSIPSR